MAISDVKKVDLLWKKIGYGVTKTDDANRKSASNESISSPLILRGDRVWVNSEQIPAILPQSSSEYVQVYSDYLNNTIECIMDNTSTPLRTWKTSLTDWIPVEFGPTYQVKVYVDNPASSDPVSSGTRLFPDGTGSDEWYFDYSAGVLHFIGDSLPAGVINGKVIYVTGARYVGPMGLENFSTTSTEQGTLPASQTYTGDGTTQVFALSDAPASAEAIDVYVNDVLQRPGEVYSVTGTDLEFTVVPPSGADIYVKHRYSFATVAALPDGSIQERHLDFTYTSDQYNTDGRIYDVNPGHTVNSVLVILDGLILPPQQYRIVGSVLELQFTPDENSLIDIRYLPV